MRRSTKAYSRGDLDQMLETWAPDAVLDWSNSLGLEAEIVRGRGEIRRYIERFRETFEEIRIELEDLAEVQDGIVIAENLYAFEGVTGSKPRLEVSG